jgi:hypothetical protein
MPMVTAERQVTSRLIALDEESEILGYTQTADPKRFLRELSGSGKLVHQVRIYQVCPLATDDVDHYYDFEATCLLRREPGRNQMD